MALTAYAMREHRERIAAAGANGLISKPITSVEALGRGLAAHVAPRRAPAAPTAPRRPAPRPAGPVIDLAIFDALCEAIGAGHDGRAARQGDRRPARRRSGTSPAALEPLDRAPIRSASHILISVAGALGAVRLQACARGR